MTELQLIEQMCRDLNQAHDEIVKLQGQTPNDFDWPAWTPQANSIRAAEKLIGRKLAKTDNWTLFPSAGQSASKAEAQRDAEVKP